MLNIHITCKMSMSISAFQPISLHCLNDNLIITSNRKILLKRITIIALSYKQKKLDIRQHHTGTYTESPFISVHVVDVKITVI